MIYSDDGTTVTLTMTEWGELNGRIERSERRANSQVSEAQEKRITAERLLAECMNKDTNMRYQLDMKQSLNHKENALAQMVRMTENLMREVYHECADVSRTNRTELEDKMKELRGY